MDRRHLTDCREVDCCHKNSLKSPGSGRLDLINFPVAGLPLLREVTEEGISEEELASRTSYPLGSYPAAGRALVSL